MLGAIGRIATTFVSGQPNAHQFVWNAIAPWVNELTRSATEHWLPVLVQGIACEVIERDDEGLGIRCPKACIAACGVCRKPCCVDHSFVSKSGAAVCYPCARRASAEFAAAQPAQAKAGRAADEADSHQPPPRQPPPKSPRSDPPPHQNKALLAEARKILGIRHAKPSGDEVRSAFRRLSLKHHPDRPGGSQEAFVAITRARDLLLKALEESSPP